MKKLLVLVALLSTLPGCAMLSSNCDTVDSGVANTVYFDFDSSALRADAQATLDAEAVEFAKTDEPLVVAGHADERGTREYNLALGERRANAVKTYLVSKGIADSRISTTSFGKDKPAVEGHNEAAWSKNRRAETLLEDVE